MAKVAPGDRIFIPVKADTGAFPSERLITFDAIHGPISGFISADQVRDKDGSNFIEAEVLEVSDVALVVNLHGSFFTTTGRASISPASQYLHAAWT